MSEQGRQEAEALREAAELERERREELRRIGEGGPEQHVPGSVQTGRVEAEERRTSVRGFYLRLATSVALPLAFLALLPSLVGIYLLNDQAAENRARIAENRAALAYLCQTTSALNLVIGQLEAVDKTFLVDPSLTQTVKDKIRSRIRVYNIAQAEFDRRAPCGEIE